MRCLKSETGKAASSSFVKTQVCQPAASGRELDRAFRLVYTSYLPRGYVRPTDGLLRLSIFEPLPGTVTFVGFADDEVIATMSLIVDTPMDSIYHPELHVLRSAGSEVAEANIPADRRAWIERTSPMLMLLTE